MPFSLSPSLIFFLHYILTFRDEPDYVRQMYFFPVLISVPNEYWPDIHGNVRSTRFGIAINTEYPVHPFWQLNFISILLRLKWWMWVTGQPYDDHSILGMRAGCTLLGCAIIPFSFLTGIAGIVKSKAGSMSCFERPSVFFSTKITVSMVCWPDLRF